MEKMNSRALCKTLLSFLWFQYSSQCCISWLTLKKMISWQSRKSQVGRFLIYLASNSIVSARLVNSTYCVLVINWTYETFFFRIVQLFDLIARSLLGSVCACNLQCNFQGRCVIITENESKYSRCKSSYMILIRFKHGVELKSSLNGLCYGVSPLVLFIFFPCVFWN